MAVAAHDSRGAVLLALLPADVAPGAAGGERRVLHGNARSRRAADFGYGFVYLDAGRERTIVAGRPRQGQLGTKQ